MTAMIHLLVCAVALGAITALLRQLVMKTWNITLEKREAGLVVGGAVGLLVGMGMTKYYGVSAIVGGTSVFGYFLMKIVKRPR